MYMPKKRNWKRDDDRERSDRTVKYAWRNRKFKDYMILVIDLKKEIGRYHEDYREDERYAVDVEFDDRTLYSEYEGTLDSAFNSSVDLQEDFPDPRELHLKLGPEDDNPEAYPMSE